MKPVRYLLGIVIALALITMSIVISGGKITYFLDVGSLIMVVVPTFALLVSAYGGKTLFNSFLLAFTRDEAEKEDYARAAAVVGSSRLFLYLSAITGSIVGIITMLLVESPLVETRVGAALILMTPIYALILHWAFIEPIRIYLKKESL